MQSTVRYVGTDLHASATHDNWHLLLAMLASGFGGSIDGCTHIDAVCLDALYELFEFL